MKYKFNIICLLALFVILILLIFLIVRCLSKEEKFHKRIFGSPYNTILVNPTVSHGMIGIPFKKYIPSKFKGLPKNFDSRIKWPGCIGKVRNQGQCASCWAFAVAEVAGDRLCISSCQIVREKEKIPKDGLCIYPHKKAGDSIILNRITLDTLADEANRPWMGITGEYANKPPFLFPSDQWLPPLDVRTPYADLTFLDITDSGYVTWYNFLRWMSYYNVPEEAALEIWMSIQKPIYNVAGSMIGVDFSDEAQVRQNKGKFSKIQYRSALSKKDFEKIGSQDMNKGIEQALVEEKSIVGGPPELSVSQLLLCSSYPYSTTFNKNMKKITADKVCQGSTLRDAWRYLTEHKITTNDCMGYNLHTAKNNKAFANLKDLMEPLCKKSSAELLEEGATCYGYQNLGGNYFHSFSTLAYYTVPGSNAGKTWGSRPENIMREILENGPISTGMEIEDSFLTWSGGQTYSRTGKKSAVGNEGNVLIWNQKKSNKKTATVEGHAFKVIGWGEYHDPFDNSFIPYWICVNSWGWKWGTTGDNAGGDGLPSFRDNGGCFWVLRGKDVGFIESNVVVGASDLLYYYPDESKAIKKKDLAILKKYGKFLINKEVPLGNEKGHLRGEGMYDKLITAYDGTFSLYAVKQEYLLTQKQNGGFEKALKEIKKKRN